MSLACKEGNPTIRMRVSVYRYRYSVYMYIQEDVLDLCPGQRDVVTCTSGAHRDVAGSHAHNR